MGGQTGCGTESYINFNENGTSSGKTGQGKLGAMVRFCQILRGWEGRRALCGESYSMHVCYSRVSKREEQFMVYESMSEIGG